MYNFISEYNDPKTGEEFHQVFQVPFALDKKSALYAVLAQIKAGGYEPTAVALIRGNYTLAELRALAEDPTAPDRCVAHPFSP